MRLVSEMSVMPDGVSSTFGIEDKYYLYVNELLLVSKSSPKTLQIFDFTQHFVTDIKFNYPILDVFKTEINNIFYTMSVLLKDNNTIAFTYTDGNTFLSHTTYDDINIIDVAVVSFIESPVKFEIKFFMLGSGLDGVKYIFYCVVDENNDVKTNRIDINHLFFNPIQIEASRYPNMIYIRDLHENKIITHILIINQDNTISIHSKNRYIDIVNPDNPKIISANYPVKFLELDNGEYLVTKLNRDYLIGYDDTRVFLNISLPISFRDYRINQYYAMLISDDLIKIYPIGNIATDQENVFKESHTQNHQINFSGNSKYAEKYMEQFLLQNNIGTAWYKLNIQELIRIMIAQDPRILKKGKTYMLVIPSEINSSRDSLPIEEIAIILNTDNDHITLTNNLKYKAKRNEVVLKPYD